MPLFSRDFRATIKGMAFSSRAIFILLALLAPIGQVEAQTNILINEFMASNKKSLLDEDGASSDWLELYNPTTNAVNLAGWFLTDATNNLTEWQIPNVTMLPDTYLVIFASGKNRTNPVAPLHTNFQLAKGGQYLGLLDPGTNIVSDFYPQYPAQQTDVSYGRDRTFPDLVGYFAVPTPGGPNSSSGAGFGPELNFSRNSSTFATPFTLVLSLKDPSPSATNVVIRYTLDGTFPTPTSPLYVNPLSISGTTQVRARAFQPGYFPGPPRSESYLLLAPDVLAFSSELPIVVLHSIYPVPGAPTPPENPKAFTSMELFEPYNGRSSVAAVPSVSTRAGISNHGSSTAGQPKHNFNLELWDDFNAGNNLSLDGLPSNNDFILYAPDNFEPVVIHNPFMYEMSNEIGRYATRTRFVEVFVNLTGGPLGLTNYNGLYVLEENIKIDQDRVNIDKMTVSNTAPPAVTGGYLMSVDRANGGVTLNTPTLPKVPAQSANFLNPSGNTLALPQWAPQLKYINNYFYNFVTNLNSTNFADPVTGYSQYIDVDAWIDHHILDNLALNVDALRLSAFFYKPRDGKITFGPIWDFDRTLGSTDGRDFSPRVWRSTVPDLGTDMFGFGTQSWWGRLFQDPEFWQKWIDRWQQLRRNQFSTNNLDAVIDAMVGPIREAEARDVARWPGFITLRSGSVSGSGYTYNFGATNGYQGEVNFMKQWLADRVIFIDTNFVAAPVFNQFGGPVSNGFTLTLSAGAGATIYYTLDSTDPRLRGGIVSPSAQVYSAPITISNNVRVVARAWNPSHKNLTVPPAGNPPTNSTWSGPVDSLFVVTSPSLVITEIMYHPEKPPAGNTNSAEDFEYIELKNIGPAPLDLSGIHFINGISFSFTGSSITSLEPGQYVLVVKNIALFTSRYGLAGNIAGEYGGNLNNGGDRLSLVGPLGEPILDFSYDNQWYPITDGLGFSLVIVNENAALNTWGLKESWRPSGVENGSPAAQDPPPLLVSPLLVNEVLSNPVLPQPDAIELYNPNASPLDISGWFLTDNFSKPKKYRIPDGAAPIPGGGYAYFTAAQFDPTPGVGDSFAFSSTGDAAYVFSGDAQTNLTGYFHGFSFGAAEIGVSHGRYITSEGRVHFAAQSAVTLGATNAAPKVGPVVISEIMYHPRDFLFGTNKVDDVHDEYIRLSNITAGEVPLFDPAYPTNTWLARGGIGFSFPTNVTIPVGGEILLVNFDPSASPLEVGRFRGQFGLAPNLPLFGPYNGKLNNAGDNIELAKPAPPEPLGQKDAGFVAYILAEKVEYSNLAPWPAGADGTGASLRRLDLAAYGNDPINWQATLVMRATIVSQPRNQVVRLSTMTSTTVTNVSFNVAALGSPPITYQWLFNGTTIAGATNTTYTLTNVSFSSQGSCQVMVTDAVGSLTSDPGNLGVLVAPVISQPLPSQPITLLQGNSITYTVAVMGYPPPFVYQWRRGSFTFTNISLSSTSCTLTLFNLQPGNSALYRVVITNLASLSGAVPANSTNSLTVLADSDGDGIPDFWEILYGLNPHDPSDANADPDGDGMTNLQEYLAGTDPTNALSYLKIDRLHSGLGPNSLQFSAVSNKTYSLQYKESAPAGRWTRFADVASRPSNRVETVLDPFPAASTRLYRLATPQLLDPTNVGPAILTSPQSLRAAVGDDASLNVFAVGVGSLSYQWLFNGNNLNGATTSTLLRNNVQLPDAGNYAVTVSDQRGSQTSDPAILALRPFIAAQPQSQSVAAGTEVIMSVVATGSAPLAYRWRHDGLTLPGPINSVLTLSNVQTTNAGNYSVMVTVQTPLGILGTVSSNAALVVLPPR